MHRIDGPGATNDNRFTEGDPANGARATVVTDEWLNAVQEEVANAIEGDGQALNKADSEQLSGVLRRRVIRADSVAAIEALAFADGWQASLLDGGRSGPFRFNSADLSAEVSSDPLQGIYVAPTSDATGASGAWVRQYGQTVILRPPVKPEWWGAVGDGVVLDTASIVNAWSLRGAGGTLELNGSATYLIDASDGTDVGNGRLVLCYADTEDNPRIIGNGATVKVVDHDVSSGQGLMFAGGTANKRPFVSGINFDMTFVGRNTSSSFYPFIGGVWFGDFATGSKTQSQLNSDVVVEDCTFKLFHTLGAYAKTSSPFNGDDNNGFKLFTVFIDGDHLATSYANQNRNATIRNCTVKEGHNGYGFWIWAYNNSVFDNPTAESYVSKATDSDGSSIVEDAGLPFVRYTQFYTKGVTVTNIQFRAKPSADRLTAGFEGQGKAIGFKSNNVAAGLDGGLMRVNGGYILAGNGDSANSMGEDLIECNAYGALHIGGGLIIDAYPEDSNSQAGTAIHYNSVGTGGTGHGECHIDVTFTKNLKHYQNIDFRNGADAIADRRCKVLRISGVSHSQNQYFLDMDVASTKAFLGCEYVMFSGLIVDGTDSFFGPASTNSRAMRLASSAGDSIKGESVTIKNVYHEFFGTSLDANTRIFFENYSSSGTNQRAGGTKVPVFTLAGTGDPSDQIAGVGSTYLRLDGGAGDTFYVKESGTDGTGWVAK